MRKSFVIMAAMAASMMGAQAAYADVTCEPGSCVNTATGTPAPSGVFNVTPVGIGPDYTGPITATIGNTVKARNSTSSVDFTDTFNFFLTQDGFGTGSAINSINFIGKNGDIDFTDLIINGVSGAATSLFQISNVGGVSTVSALDVALKAGFNSIQIKGKAFGTASYGGVINFAPAVPELATWGMMILGFIGVGAAMRRRRNTTVTFGNKRAFA